MNSKTEWEVFVLTAPLEDSIDPMLSDNPTDDNEQEAKERTRWALIKDGIHDYEISAIRKNNEHGHNSWGYGNADNKIILFSEDSNSLNTDENDVVSEETFNSAKDMTQEFCNMLNSREINDECESEETNQYVQTTELGSVTEIQKHKQMHFNLDNNTQLKMNVFAPVDGYDEVKYFFDYRYVENENDNPHSDVTFVNDISVYVQYNHCVAQHLEIQMNMVFPERLGRKEWAGMDISPNAKLFIQFIYEKEKSDKTKGNKGGFRLRYLETPKRRIDLKTEPEKSAIMQPVNFPFIIKDFIELDFGYEVPFKDSDGNEQIISFPESIEL